MHKLLFISLMALSFNSFAEPEIESSQKADKTMIVTELQKFNPETQIPALKGYNLRARKIIVPAGVSIAEHAHDTRPGVVYVESGEIVEYRGETSRLLKAGDSLIEDATTVHSYKNLSDKDCVVIAFDLPTISE